nr:Zn-ribbon domain-containing OB-fold protein [Ardenticatena sp.]
MDIPRHWRLHNQRYKLEGSRCTRCGTLAFPPRPICRVCRSRDMEPYTFSGRGTVYSYSVVYQSPEGFEAYVPYVVALIDLEEGVRITAQLTDVNPDEVYIGMPVEMVVRKIREDGERGLIVYGYKFRPPLTA